MSTLLKFEDFENFYHNIHAASPEYAEWPSKIEAGIVESYPHTKKLLFTIALKMVDEYYGEEAAEILPAVMDARTFSSESVMPWLLYEISLLSPWERRQVLDEWHFAGGDFTDLERQQLAQLADHRKVEGLLLAVTKGGYRDDLKEFQAILLKTELSSHAIQALREAFHDFYARLINKSHLTILLLLEMGLEERALVEVFKISHEAEQGKALAEVISFWLGRGQVEQAVALYDYLPATYEKHVVIDRIIDKWLEMNKVESALEFLGKIVEPGEQDWAVRKVAFWLSKNDSLGKAISLIDQCLAAGDERDYTYSLIANVLARQGKLEESKKIAQAIGDPGYRQDAGIYPWAVPSGT